MRVAVVTGASRGAGRAIAEELGALGMTVYATGRSTRAVSSPEGLPGTIEETAAAVDAHGGRGIAVRCDHAMDDEVGALFARVREEYGALHLLVNNVWGGYEHHPGAAAFLAPFWEQPLSRWQAMVRVGVRAHLVASRLAVPLLRVGRTDAEPPPLIATTLAWAFGAYLGNAVYDVAKAATARLAFAMAQDLRPHGIASVAVAPGFMRTERVLAATRERGGPAGSESPFYLARAIAALASDHAVLARSGDLLTAGELARDYGFTDVDGAQPEPFRLR